MDLMNSSFCVVVGQNLNGATVKIDRKEIGDNKYRPVRRLAAKWSKEIVQ